MKHATIKNPITPQAITVIITKTAVTAGLFFQKLELNLLIIINVAAKIKRSYLDIEPEAAAADTGVKVGETVEVVGRSLDVADVVGSTREVGLLLLSVLLPVLVLVTMTNVVATNEVLLRDEVRSMLIVVE